MKRYNLSHLVTFSFLLISIFALGANAQSKKDREAARKLEEQANKAFAAKNFREAADKYGQSLALVATNPAGHFRKGYAHFNLQESDQALSEFALALSQGFKPLEVLKLRAFIYFDQKNYDSALEEVNKALAIEPRDLVLLKSNVSKPSGSE